MKNIAVEGMELEITGYTDCKFDIKTDPSDNSLIDDKGVYAGPIMVQLTSAKRTVGEFVSSPPFQLQPTAQYVTVDNNAVLLEGDKGQGQAVWQVGSSSETVSFECTVKKAGQTSTQGE